MERIASAMQDGRAPGRVRGMRRQHEPRANLILSCRRTSVTAHPRVGGTFWFQIFIRASSPEIWRKTIFGGEGDC